MSLEQVNQPSIGAELDFIKAQVGEIKVSVGIMTDKYKAIDIIGARIEALTEALTDLRIRLESLDSISQKVGSLADIVSVLQRQVEVNTRYREKYEPGADEQISKTQANTEHREKQENRAETIVTNTMSQIAIVAVTAVISGLVGYVASISKQVNSEEGISSEVLERVLEYIEEDREKGEEE